MRGIKTPQYEFALKMQGGLMREGGRICGTLRYILNPGLLTDITCKVHKNFATKVFSC